ncbi:hypothetical protein [Hyphomicrobium sp.]|uniref:anti-sigma factor family protein n=1 Tax=Hyphomicrobium sp. TaxID=82 RepID=UPI0025B81DC1|nr:hypothetical protein [Hyphomicrobium sp.]MCC7250967.1 hypothetical protein [Hyphomicrobium sp.]
MTERDDIEALLPWYVTGRLAPAERARVEAYLDAHPDAARGLALAREEAEASIAASDAIAPPDPAALERLMASIASAPQYRRASAAKPGLIERLARWLSSLAPHQLAYAAAGLIALLMLQAVTLGTVFMMPDAVYQTATGPDGGAARSSPAELLIGFAPEATMADVSHFLKENGLTVVDGPRAGLYRVRSESQADAATLADKLKTSPIVASVLPGR